MHTTAIKNTWQILICKRVVKLLLMLSCMTLLFPATPLQAESKKYNRSVERYMLPDVVLIDQNGKKVRLATLLKSDQPVIVDFIFGTCTSRVSRP